MKTRTFVLRTISNGVRLVARFLADGTDVAEKDLEMKCCGYRTVISEMKIGCALTAVE